MDWIPRYYEKEGEAFFQPGKVVILYGPRRVGKTALVQRLIRNQTRRWEKGRTSRVFFSTGEDADLADVLTSFRIETYRLFFSPYDTICVDEAQYIPRIGYCLKLLVDQFPDKRVLVTGSSSLGLSQSVMEPLTGRSVVRTLYPLSLGELRERWEPLDLYRNLETFLLFGTYPEVFSQSGISHKIEYLIQLRNSYLFRDILILEQIKNSRKLQDILKLLALQIGSQVSTNEIATAVGLSRNTVERYLDLLEKSFVIKKVPAFSRNLRKEVSKSAKYYFWDTGVRNAVVNNFNPLDKRADGGALWENFAVMELVKKHEYDRSYANFYFWRTYDQKELDLVVETQDALRGYEIKWKEGGATQPVKGRALSLWERTYGTAETITREGLLERVL